MSAMRNTFVLLLIAGLVRTASAQDLTILHLNDTHSHIDPERNGKNAGRGGVIEQAAYIDSVRCADGKGNVLLLHAGDFSQGTSYFVEMGGDIEIDVLNTLGFDAVCLGNHEFDNGLEELARRIRRLDVPVVCANYDFTGTSLEGLVEPYVVLNNGQRKIGVIGLLANVKPLVTKDIASQLKYLDPAESAMRYAGKLRNEMGCDLVICLTHLGYVGEEFTDVKLASSIRGVDVIVGGHSHTFMEDMAKVRDLDGKDVIIVTDGKWGYNIGQLSVDFQKNRLTELYKEVGGLDAFSADGTWLPYPAYEDREGWKSLLGAHADRLVKAAEKYLDYQWQNVLATSYLAYERTGERTTMENPLKQNRIALNTLMLAELAEGRGRFVDQLVNGVWHISHMPSWVLSAHLPRQRTKRSLPDFSEQLIDLGSGALGAQMSVICHFFQKTFDDIDPVISRTIKAAVKRQILDPYLNPDEQRPNWWLAFDLKPGSVVNNWNPWCNADVILCFLLLEDDKDRLDRALRQSAKSVDKFLAYVKTDGACEEGPAYWGHAAGKLYDYLQIMNDASSGRFSLFTDSQIKDMGEYISRSFVKDGWVVNFADASAKLSFTPSLIYNYGKAVNSQEMQDFAIYNLADADKGRFNSPVPVIWNDVYRALESLKYIVEMTSKVDKLNAKIDAGTDFSSCRDELRTSVPDFTWYPETEFCYMKNASGWFVAAKGGHNNESHNHNDIGTFILYADGVPMFVDAGVGTYTKKTFSKDRYTIWSMCSDWHNLPIINEFTQKNGAEYRSSAVCAATSRAKKSFGLDLSGAYPDEAGCAGWIREYVLSDKTLTITDSYSLVSRTSADVENFMVQGQVLLPGQELADGRKVKDGEVVVINGKVVMKLAYPKSFIPSVKEITLDDPRFTGVWGESLRRISFTGQDTAPLKGKYVFRISEM